MVLIENLRTIIWPIFIFGDRLFWQRWVRECLPLLTPRQAVPSHQAIDVRDVVLIADGKLPRNHWPLGKVVKNLKVYILCTTLVVSFCAGIILSFPSVLSPALTKGNSTDIKTTGDHASWINAVYGVSGMVGCFLVTPIFQIFGRKACSILISTLWLIGWIMMFFAANVTTLYAARIIQGFTSCGVYITVFVLSEYVHPRRRGYFITLKKAFNALGALYCHSMSHILTWRQIASSAAVLCCLSIVMTLFWPESPSHLASKRKFEECETAFKWLHGDSEENQKHLKALLEARREKITTNKENSSLVELLKKFLKKDFQKAFVISSVLTVSIDVCGRYYYMAYIIQIMTELMHNNTSGLYLTIGADMLTVAAVFMSTVVIKYVKRRTILFSSGIFSVLLMILISAVTYLNGIYYFSKPVLWFTALIVILQSFIVNIGVIPVAFAIISEIFPLEHKGFGSFVSCFVFTSFYAVILKVTPVLMEYTKLYGTFAIFGVILAICLAILYKVVPETKDKTLQEIEDEMNNVPNREITVVEREKLMH